MTNELKENLARPVFECAIWAKMDQSECIYFISDSVSTKRCKYSCGVSCYSKVASVAAMTLEIMAMMGDMTSKNDEDG